MTARRRQAAPRSALWLSVLACLALLLVPAHRLGAQPRAPDVSATLSADEVEVGESFTVDLQAWSESNNVPGDPQLYVPNGLDVRGPRVTTQFQTRFGTGVNYVKQGIRATWQLVGERPGSYVIPAPTVVVEGERVSAGRTMKVKVVPATGRPRKKPASDPFGFPAPFGMGGRSPFGFDFDSLFQDQDQDQDDESRMNEQAEALAMSAEREPYVFLRAVADKTRVVVGEQVTLSFYVYYRADFEMTDRHEPGLADFLRVSMLTSPGADPPVRTRVGQYRYLVRLLDRVAIFPLRSGTLRTGTLTARFTGARVGRGVERASNDLTIETVEPPKEGRPSGYRLGDVGSFRLSADVKPREITAGGTVAVLVRLQGIGNIPTSIEVPDRAGVEWLDPQIRSDVTVTNGQVGGWRTFGYVVKVDEPGQRFLGEITLPYYDPDRREYAVARVDLGNVAVAPGSARPDATAAPAASPAGSESPADPFGRLGPARLSLRPFVHEPARGIEPRTFWPLWAAPPLVVLLGGALRRMARRWAERRAARREDPAGLAQRALREMAKATALADKAAAAERAIHLAIEGAAKVKSRGVLLADLPDRLQAAGLSAPLAADCARELERCTSVRFVPGEAGRTARELEATVRELVRRLGAVTRKTTGRPVAVGDRPTAAPTNGPASSAAPSRRGGATLVVLGLLAALAGLSTAATAAPSPDELFRDGTNALGEGDFDRAIELLEAMADQGTLHPDASYNRGLAYVARVRAGAERPGDLGRAAAAFEEVLVLRDDDADAEVALEVVHAEVARRGARRGKDVVTERPSLDRLLVELGSERSWGIAALVASLLCAVGLALRSAKGRPLYIVSRVLPPLALGAMALLTPLYLGARALRLETRAGVVVVPELYLADESGRSLGGDAVPEAARVEVGERRGRMLQVRWGAREGWAALGSVRLVDAR